MATIKLLNRRYNVFSNLRTDFSTDRVYVEDVLPSSFNREYATFSVPSTINNWLDFKNSRVITKFIILDKDGNKVTQSDVDKVCFINNIGESFFNKISVIINNHTFNENDLAYRSYIDKLLRSPIATTLQGSAQVCKFYKDTGNFEVPSGLITADNNLGEYERSRYLPCAQIEAMVFLAICVT